MSQLSVLIALFLAGLPLLVFVPTAQAVTGNISQPILPLECVFETVNDGSNTIIYITPEECGVIIPPDPEPEPNPNPTPGPSPGGTPIGGSITPPTRIQTGTGIIQTPAIVIPGGPTGSQAARELPFEPVAVLQSVEEAERSQALANTSVTIAAVVVGLTAIGLIILIALV